MVRNPVILIGLRLVSDIGWVLQTSGPPPYISGIVLSQEHWTPHTKGLQLKLGIFLSQSMMLEVCCLGLVW